MSQPKKARPIWIVEYRAINGEWYPAGEIFHDSARLAKIWRLKVSDRGRQTIPVTELGRRRGRSDRRAAPEKEKADGN